MPKSTSSCVCRTCRQRTTTVSWRFWTRYWRCTMRTTRWLRMSHIQLAGCTLWTWRLPRVRIFRLIRSCVSSSIISFWIGRINWPSTNILLALVITLRRQSKILFVRWWGWLRKLIKLCKGRNCWQCRSRKAQSRVGLIYLRTCWWSLRSWKGGRRSSVIVGSAFGWRLISRHSSTFRTIRCYSPPHHHWTLRNRTNVHSYR